MTDRLEYLHFQHQKKVFQRAWSLHERRGPSFREPANDEAEVLGKKGKSGHAYALQGSTDESNQGTQREGNAKDDHGDALQAKSTPKGNKGARKSSRGKKDEGKGDHGYALQGDNDERDQGEHAHKGESKRATKCTKDARTGEDASAKPAKSVVARARRFVFS